MANTIPLSYRIDSNIKSSAESIIYDLAMAPTVAIQMFYKQIIINHGLPFNAKLQTYEAPKAFGSLSKEELNTELMKGYESIKNDKKYSVEEVGEIFAKEFGI